MLRAWRGLTGGPRGDIDEPRALCGAWRGRVVVSGACETGSCGVAGPGDVAAESSPAPRGNAGARRGGRVRVARRGEATCSGAGVARGQSPEDHSIS